VAALQVCKTFEDLYAEALRINAGRPSLAPYASVAHKEVDCQEGGSAGDATKPARASPPWCTPRRSCPSALATLSS
jgi:hypothetical protein